MTMNDLLQAMLAGRGNQPAQAGAGDDPLAGILGALLGGAGATQQPGATTGGAGAGGLVQALVQILGGRQEFTGIIEGLAAKLGLPPAMAQTVVAFVLEKLLSGGSTAAKSTSARKRQPATTAPQTGSGGTRKPTRPDSGSLRDLFQQGARINPSYLKRSGLANELAQRTGMEPATAVQSLDYVFGALQGRANQLSSTDTQVEGLNVAPQGHRRDLPPTAD